MPCLGNADSVRRSRRYGQLDNVSWRTECEGHARAHGRHITHRLNGFSSRVWDNKLQRLSGRQPTDGIKGSGSGNLPVGQPSTPVCSGMLQMLALTSPPHLHSPAQLLCPLGSFLCLLASLSSCLLLCLLASLSSCLPKLILRLS